MSHLYRLSRRAVSGGAQPISYLMQQAVENPGCISLAAGLVDQQTLPVAETREVVDSLLSDAAAGRAALQYGTTPGYLPLRERLLAHVEALDGRSARELKLGVDQVVVTAGSQQLLSLVSDVLLDPDDIVLVSEPTYFVYLGVVAGTGARAVGVAMDDDGMIPEALEDRLRAIHTAGELPRVKLIYLVTYYQNPTGRTLSESRRGRIVEIARRWSQGHRIYILEDAAYRELRYEGPALPSLRSFDEAGDTVILTQTFSKSCSPGLRTGYGFLPPALVGPVCDLKGNLDFGSPNFNQHVVHRLMTTGLYERHLHALWRSYRAKRDVMLEAADEYFSDFEGVQWVHPRGGLYVWMTLPDEVDAGIDGPLFKRAIAEGVMYVPGHYCYPPRAAAGEGWVGGLSGGDGRRPRVPPSGRNTMRLSFGVQDEAGLREGMRRLATALRSVVPTKQRPQAAAARENGH